MTVQETKEQDENDDQTVELMNIFDSFDVDESGAIDRTELSNMLNSMDIFMSDAELDAAFVKIDTDNSGTIDFDEFMGFVLSKIKGQDDKSVMLEIFKIMDTDGNGVITRDEFEITALILKLDLSSSDLKEIFDSCDLNKDGVIQFNEFMEAKHGVWSKMKLTYNIARACKEILAQYTKLAVSPEDGFGIGESLPYGKENAKKMGYDVDMLPEKVWESSCMCGDSFPAGTVSKGDTVIDFGCGAGADVCVAATLTGPEGRVIGIDMTPAMIEKGEENTKLCKLSNAEFILSPFDLGSSPKIPEACADLVIFNGTFNLSSRKKCALVQAMKCLKPGGKLIINDVFLEGQLPRTESSGSWCDCIAGALPVEKVQSMLESVGFVDFKLGGYTGYDTSPATKGVTIMASKTLLPKTES